MYSDRELQGLSKSVLWRTIRSILIELRSTKNQKDNYAHKTIMPPTGIGSWDSSGGVSSQSSTARTNEHRTRTNEQLVWMFVRVRWTNTLWTRFNCVCSMCSCGEHVCSWTSSFFKCSWTTFNHACSVCSLFMMFKCSNNCSNNSKF